MSALTGDNLELRRVEVTPEERAKMWEYAHRHRAEVPSLPADSGSWGDLID